MPDHTNKQKILVIKLSALGDFIQALGPMAAIREHHKDAHITILTTRAFEGFARKCGYFDEVWLDTRPKLLNFKGWATLRKRLNDGKFTRVYDLQNNDRTNFYFKLFKNKPEWIGAAPGAQGAHGVVHRGDVDDGGTAIHRDLRRRGQFALEGSNDQ